MPDKEIKTVAEFEAFIKQKKVLVDFFATWCGPCRMQTPVLEAYVAEHGETTPIARLDVDIVGEIASRYGVYSIPTLIVFGEGKEKGRNVGYLPLGPLTRFIDRN
ncbi:MAG: thioredoxin domain-containing protein [Firmicutes bacterium]|nr:thioredoxin domain-containing protein [Bacillota bacterium]